MLWEIRMESPACPARFSIPAPSSDNTIPFTFGNAGRNIVRGPGFQNWDFSIFKMFPVREQMRFEFRAEFFNIWNHVNPLFEPSRRNQRRASAGGVRHSAIWICAGRARSAIYPIRI